MSNQAEILKQKLLQSIGLPFREALPESVIESVLLAEGVKYYDSVYNPAITVWAFLSQVLDPDKSLRNTVSRVIAWLSEAGQKVPSPDTGAYSKARSRLPEGVVKQLLNKSAQALEEQVSEEELWCGRRVTICDGSAVLMSDTPENQAVYPQHSNQKSGCGFPIAKIVVMFSLITGAMVAGLIDTFNTSGSGNINYANMNFLCRFVFVRQH